jgi:SAM-dependent methyltransferase
VRLLKILLRPIYHRVFRLCLRSRFWLADRSAKMRPRTLPPLPPAVLRYRVGESLSIDGFLRTGKACAGHVDEGVRETGTSLKEAKRVLDFGCGCGRTLRWLIESYPTTQFYGVDVDADAIAWCAKNLEGSRFANTGPLPPLPFPSGYFDIAYCFSVFTHLDEVLQDIWLKELRRIVRPQGIVILTVHGQKAAKILGQGAATEFARAGFVHLRSRKLAGIVPDWYHTSWHSEAYIVGRLSALFTDVHYTAVCDGIQDLVVARVG